MRIRLFIISLLSVFCIKAQDTEIEFVIPELPVIQLCAVEETTQDPVPFASITVEYVDSVVNCSTDAMGLLDFTPLSFPLTVTATGEGMKECSYALMSHPEEPLFILMTRDPAKEQKNTAVIALDMSEYLRMKRIEVSE